MAPPLIMTHYHWQKWLNTRNTPFPGEPERICDTVAAWVHREGTEPPLATVIEFLVDPSPQFLQHLAAYTSDVRQDHPYQSSHPVVQYETIGVVVVLTGAEQPSTWTCKPAHAEGAGHTFGAIVRTLATRSASETLARIERGELGRCVLPWIVLMQGGDESANIALWKRLASEEPDGRKRADYGGLVLVFAELAGRRAPWETALEDWNMVESEIVKKWKAKARKEALDEGHRAGLDEGAQPLRSQLDQLGQFRFSKPLPADVQQRVQAANLETLQRWFQLLLHVNSLDEFQAKTNGA